MTPLEPDGRAVWDCVLTRNRIAGNRFEGVSLAWLPDGRLLACTTGTSAVWLVDAATGRLDGQCDGHTQTVTGLSWIGPTGSRRHRRTRRCRCGTTAPRRRPRWWRRSWRPG